MLGLQRREAAIHCVLHRQREMLLIQELLMHVFIGPEAQNTPTKRKLSCVSVAVAAVGNYFCSAAASVRKLIAIFDAIAATAAPYASDTSLGC